MPSDNGAPLTVTPATGVVATGRVPVPMSTESTVLCGTPAR